MSRIITQGYGPAGGDGGGIITQGYGLAAASPPPIIADTVRGMLVRTVIDQVIRGGRTIASIDVPRHQWRGVIATIPHHNARVEAISEWSGNGVRPRHKPHSAGGPAAGSRVAYDYLRDDGSEYYALRIVDESDGVSNPVEISLGRAGLPQRHAGNARWHPTANYVVFQAEAQTHYQSSIKVLGNPGLGYHSDLWACTATGAVLTNLTNYTHKQTAVDGLPTKQVVMPHFDPTGAFLLWTETYDTFPGTIWGAWRVMVGDFSLPAGIPTLANIQPLIDAVDYGGNYIVPMGFLNASDLLVAANFDGQHEYRMDLYRVYMNTVTHPLVNGLFQTLNLTNDPFWNEGSCPTPNGRIAHMTGKYSKYPMPEDSMSLWNTYVLERDLELRGAAAQNEQVERLTYFNDALAPEFDEPLGRTTVNMPSVHPNGLSILVGYELDFSTNDTPDRSGLRIRKIAVRDPI